MRMLVIGGHGMAGHMLVRTLRRAAGVEVVYTVRNPQGAEGEIMLDAANLDDVRTVVEQVRPDVIVNCAGILNQHAEAMPKTAYIVNGLLPHWLRHLADETGGRLIHISSDCVFLGDKGGYRESDRPDGVSVYARTKALGEVLDPRHLTIRTSIIGPEIRSEGIGLLRWFLGQSGTVDGYAQVLWNGVTTAELAKAVIYAAERPAVGGLVHLTAPRTVSKLELLQLFKAAFGKEDVTIRPVETPVLDRTLARERTDWNYVTPDYPAMLEELASLMREAERL